MSRSNDAPGRNLTSPPDPPDGGGRGWVLPLVVAALVVAVFVLIGIAKRAEKPEAASTAAPTAPSTPPVPVAPAKPAPPPVTNLPVTPVANKGTNTGSTNPVAPLKLQGIVFDATEPGAIVDGKTLHVGDRIHGLRVQEITPSTLTLEDTNGTIRTLFLGK